MHPVGSVKSLLSLPYTASHAVNRPPAPVPLPRHTPGFPHRQHQPLHRPPVKDATAIKKCNGYIVQSPRNVAVTNKTLGRAPPRI